MERTAAGLNDDRTFEDYDPAVEWSHAADANIISISLPGFRKEELRVLVDNHGYLQVRGQRPAAAGGSSNWIRVLKHLKLPDNCDIDGIRSKFVDDKLTITLPKKSHPSSGSAPEPAPTMEEENEEDEEEEGEEGAEGEGEEGEEGAEGEGEKEEGDKGTEEEKEEEGDKGTEEEEEEEGERRPIRWLVVTVAAAFFVGIAGYVAWRKLTAGGAGDHGPGELAGAGSYVKEM
ncbi:unnamed protein product [Urochloa humidicola]